MKLLIASDIHGAYPYSQLLLTRADEIAPDKILLLGDLLYHGPRNDLPPEYAPKSVIEVLNRNSRRFLCVRGNCDTEVDQMVLDFPILADYALLFNGAFEIFATHGHQFNPKNPPKMNPGTILLNGHTHIPAFERCGDFLYVNPGSVSLPKEGSPHSLIVWEDNRISWLDMEKNRFYEEIRL